jgi:hypothetical protein
MTLLGEQPPPRKGAKAGYYPDPLGSGKARWWDGANWTHMLGPLVEAGSPRSRKVPPPTKVCSHCGAQSETFESNCPNCGRSYGLSRGGLIAIIAAACVAGVLLLGGCAALIVAGVNEVEEEQDAYEITREQFDSIQSGATRSSVEASLGEPYETDRFEESGLQVTCLYYPEKGEDVFSEMIEFCFVGGRLDSKHAP